MRLTPLEQNITNLAKPIIDELGFSLVLVKLRNENGSHNLQIMAENPATGRLGCDDCAKISRAVAAILDVEDPISGVYTLEVSSPGIDRPLTRIEDFETYQGYEARLETCTPLDNGQKNFRGVLKGLKKVGEHDMVLLETDTGEVELPFADFAKAKLVLSDDLIKKTANSKK